MEFTIVLLYHAPATNATKHGSWIVKAAIVDFLAEITECSRGQGTVWKNMPVGKLKEEES